jgi:hypothetical protein
VPGPDANEEAEELKSPIDEEIRQLFRRGEYAEAVPVIQDHLSGHAEDVPAYELMATALKFSGDKAGAAGALMTASELWAAQGNVLQSISAQKKAMKLGVEPDFTAARSCAPEKAAQRVPTPLLDALSDEEFAELAAGFEAHEYAEGAAIVEEGAEGDSMFVVTSGRVTVTTSKGDEQVELASLGPGEFFGEAALLSGRPRTATIRASSPTDCLELTRAALDKVLAGHPRVREVMDEFNRRRAASTIETLLGKRDD